MRDTKHLVSAIITTHNRLELLKRAVKSVHDQTYSDIELIVVDDGSTDGTREWCENQEFDYIYIEPGKGKGGNYARNLGIKAACGKYIAFLDDDDYWKEDKIEKQVTLIESKECELVFCGRTLEVIEDQNVKFVNTLPAYSSSGDLSKSILWNICMTTSCILVRKDELISVGLFDENLKFWQEYELTIRLAQRGLFYHVNEALVVYRVDTLDASRLTNKFYEWKSAVKYIREKHHKLYCKLSFSERIKANVLYWMDAMVRAKAGEHRWHYFYYVFMSLCGRIYNKLI